MSFNSQDKSTETPDLKEIISLYTKHWKWFVLSGFLSLVIAYVYLRYEIPEYIAEAKIQIVDEGSSGAGLGLFKDLDLLSNGNTEVLDEIELINSRSNFIEVVKSLGLNTKIMAQGHIIETELYTNPPVKVNFIAADSIINKSSFEFYLQLSSTTTFGYTEEEDMPVKVLSFGTNIPTPIGDIVVTPNMENFDRFKEAKIKVVVHPVNLVAQSYRTRIKIDLLDQFSNILNISLEDPIKEKAVQIIDELIRVYNKNAIEDKRLIADRTSNFIDDRIAEIYTNLSSVDQTAQDFKTGRGVTDIASEANINLNVGVANQQELANMRTQLNIAASMKDIVEQQDGFEVLPGNVGLTDPTINSTTSKYNELVLERNRLLKSSNEKNPVIVNLDQQIRGLKRNMQSSLNSTVDNLGLQVNALSNQQAIFNSKIYSAPKNERALRDITRKQETTEQLYLYLLQKREEAQIAVASTAPKSKVIDYAFNPTPFPISPRRNVVFLAFLMLGGLIPFAFIYVSDLLDNKLHNMHSLEKISMDIPVLGELPRLSRKDKKIIVREDRSVLAESLRIIRTNLDYLIKTKSIENGKNNIIFVTSSVPGEGKSFLSTNLALTIASTDKKVLLLGADVRNPKLYSFFTASEINRMPSKNKKKDVGLTEYLYDKTLEVNDIINPMLVFEDTLDVIYSGRIPPNPAELLMSKRIKDLFEEVSAKYDYVIVDTAPLMVVTDTLLISDYANHLIYVTRADITERKAVQYPMKLQEDGKIKGLAFVVNDVKVSNLGYGGKYGYGYGKSQKKWWKF
ncbi:MULTISPECIES: polysaccharide biosynthesis tyrosine autokinase [unclassified Arenibacter]|uniref:GumC family protein n=1 Tax=unclassified Arenibacter TaxID=2615047 RepID=UPI000E34058A|nr:MULTISPECIES: polysaccharide biosynthesis tyrosine autokinase [unclassified Arenibacter]MCM4164794.1 tyrosine protein kinase [Arenibacter sp. A80]RFT55860.1 polysaccharide biosynthesis tyrosine autokinase [Arenibacter sp. P308M17]